MQDLPIFISYYTGDDYYKRCSDRIKSMCSSLGINLIVEEVQDLGSYYKNTLYKPQYILQKVKELKRDVIWIDVDTSIKKYSSCFKKWESDLLFSSNTGDIKGIKASPIGIKYNEPSLNFMEEWAYSCKNKISLNEVDFDHDILKYEILPRMIGKIDIDLMKDDMNYVDFSNGKVIDNGISRTKNKNLEVSVVIDKNVRRSNSFDLLDLKNFKK
jgi:hypothetical protein